MTFLRTENHNSDAALSADPLDISVIICTRNRMASLRGTLASASRLKVPPGKAVELFLVDNGSTDDSAEVIRDFQWPGVVIHRLRVAEAGLARSQNTALRRARGRVVMFLDDDVRAPENWLAELSEPVLSGEADAVGGGVVVAEQVKPSWIRPEHEEWLASTVHWEPAREPVLIGSNMAIGRHVFRAIGGFDEDLGYAIDTMFSYRLVAAGFKLLLRHDITVEHWVEAKRATRAGLEKQARLRAEFQAFAVRHWEGRRFSFPYLRWLGAKLRLAIHRATRGRLTDANLALPEMRMLQRVSFWLAYLRRQDEPRCFIEVDGVRRRRDPVVL
jgi:glycosyltransferase involved in cell wall biosynthesis